MSTFVMKPQVYSANDIVYETGDLATPYVVQEGCIIELKEDDDDDNRIGLTGGLLLWRESTDAQYPEVKHNEVKNAIYGVDLVEGYHW